MSDSVNVCTAERFDRNAEGKAEGFDLVVITVDEGSVSSKLGTHSLRVARVKPLSIHHVAAVPSFCAPQTSHIRIAFLSPVDPSRRSPQSVQKTREPIAVMSKQSV